MRSLILVGSRSGGRRSNLRGTGTIDYVRASSGQRARHCVVVRWPRSASIAGAPRRVARGALSAQRERGLRGAAARRTPRSATTPVSPALCSRTATVPACRLALADDQHVRDLAQLGLADLARRPTRVRSSSSPRRPAARERVAAPPRRVVLAVGDRQHDRLHRREPGRQLAVEVLEQDADEALEGAEQRAVDHHRAVLGVVGAGVGRARSAPAGCSRAGRCRAARSGPASRSCACRSWARRRRRRPR